LDLYEADDQQLVQLKKTIEIACQRLDEMRRQRDELETTIEELSKQIEINQKTLSEKSKQTPKTQQSAA
jgi:HPt (histidine-containing phosphotransfer) domain-containing protein